MNSRPTAVTRALVVPTLNRVLTHGTGVGRIDKWMFGMVGEEVLCVAVSYSYAVK